MMRSSTDSAARVRPIKDESKIKFKAGYVIWTGDVKNKWAFMNDWLEYEIMEDSSAIMSLASLGVAASLITSILF